MADGDMASFDSYEVNEEGYETILSVDYEGIPKIPSIEDDELCMAKTSEALIANPGVTKVVFHQKHDYVYDYSQIKLLEELAELYKDLVKEQDILSYENITNLTADKPHSELSNKYTDLKNKVVNTLLKDPVGCYVELKRMLRQERVELKKEVNEDLQDSREQYIETVEIALSSLEETTIIEASEPYLAGHHVGDRDVYRKLFNPDVKPDFMFTQIMASYPTEAEQIDSYTVDDDIDVAIFEPRDNVQYLYHVTPPEFKLSEDKYEILDGAREIMSEQRPEEQDFVDPERMRDVFNNIGKDLIRELADFKGIDITKSEVEELTQILIRYTVGFGLIEILLEDENVQDITVNSPTGQSPIFIVHNEYDYCKTNIHPTPSDANSWASRLRLLSGRPLDEANPVLDTGIQIPGVAKARVGVITEPLDPEGTAYAFRRHRDDPWTFPLFIQNNMINELAAGLLSFIIDGNRTMLVAGTRSAGKSSLLGSMLIEIMRKYRIITVEDTMELPTENLRSLGYNIQTMKVASSLSQGSSEVQADQGIRTTLRMGDSALIVGEVRSEEAQALYEAMRVGALANVVAGTIHGDSPYGVYDRVVNDLGVPKTSFKATDIIVVANPIRSADSMSMMRRVTQISEVRDDWEDDPVAEGGFVDLMRYDSEDDELKPTQALLDGESYILKDIASNIREFAGDWDAVWDNVKLRGKIKQHLVDVAEQRGDQSLLEAPFVIQANDHFHKITNRVIDKEGDVDPDKVFFEWKEWLQKEIQRKNHSNGR
jgi:type IV secretory pathway ATPase VirB11/archaellum biosynthesis ATPase